MQQFDIFGGVDKLKFNKETEKFDIVMNEKQLQFKMVLKYREIRPQDKLDLWSTRNQTFSGKDGMTQKGMGMLAGVSDLIYDGPYFLGLEVKVRGKEHKRSHIIQQLDWGKRRVEKGHYWCIVVSVEGFMFAIDNPGKPHKDVYLIEDVEKILLEQKKTIIF
mgnify:CR=1 FL=1